MNLTKTNETSPCHALPKLSKVFREGNVYKKKRKKENKIREFMKSSIATQFEYAHSSSL